MEIKNIDRKKGLVVFDDDVVLSVEEFYEAFMDFFQKRIAGETLIPQDMEHFMMRTSSKNLELLMRGKKMEGFLEGSQGKLLTRGQKIAIGAVATIIMAAAIAVIALNSQGII